MICTPHPIFFRGIKSRRIRWAVHVARMGGEVRRILGFGGEALGKERAWKTQA
jgi:hypothetical protein